MSSVAIRLKPNGQRVSLLPLEVGRRFTGPVHRAVILFCQGYSVGLPDLRQLLWAAGLDCLFASKRGKRKRGTRVICQRLRRLWGTGFSPYSADTGGIPMYQKRPTHRLKDIGQDIFRLRNAYMHGGSIPEAWLCDRRTPPGSAYAYQLLECTEILLRRAY